MESRRILKESQIMKIHYVTGIAAIFVVAVHILMRLIVPFELSLEYDYIISNYKNIFYVLILESILVPGLCSWIQWSKDNIAGIKTE